LPGRAVGQQRGAVDGGGHLRQLGLRELEVGQHAAEHLARGGALQGLVQRAPGKAQGRCGHRGAEHIQRAHRDLEALTRRADALAGGTRHCLKRSRASGCGAITSMRSAISKPGVSASTMKA
jgi:hypothetical protein